MSQTTTTKERELLTEEILSILKKCKKDEKKTYINQLFEYYHAHDIDQDVLDIIASESIIKESNLSEKKESEQHDTFFSVDESDACEDMDDSSAYLKTDEDEDEFELEFDLPDEEDEEDEDELDTTSFYNGLVDLSSLSLADLVELNKHCRSYAPMYFLRKKLFDTFCGTGGLSELAQDVPLSHDIADDIFLAALQTGSPLSMKVLEHKYKENCFSAPDEWLVLLIQSNNHLSAEAKDILTTRLVQFIKKIVNSLKPKRIHSRYRDADDFGQEAFMGLLNSFSDYKIERKTRFQDFARMVINKHIRTQVNKEFNKRNKASSNSLSYYKQVSDDPSDTTFLDLISSESLTPEHRVIVFESIQEALPILTDLERNVLVLKFHGFSYKEIAEVMDTNVKGVDNGIQRIHKKGDKYRSEEYILQGTNPKKKETAKYNEEEIYEMMISGLEKVALRNLPDDTDLSDF